MAGQIKSLVKKIFSSDKGSDSFSIYSEKALNNAWYLTDYLPDPDKIVQKLGGRKYLKTLLEDDEISSAVEVRKAAALSTPWKIDGGDTNVNGFITDEITKNVNQIMKDSFMAILLGYNVLEQVWAQSDSGIILAKIQAKPLDWFIPGQNGLAKFKESIGRDAIEYPQEKFLLIQNDPSFENPYGEAVLSRVFYPYKFRCAGWQFWADALQKFAVPFLHGKTNSQEVNGKSTVEQLALMLDSAKRGSAIATDKDTEISILGGNLASGVFSEFDTAVNDRIRRKILGQNLTSAASGESLAIGKVHNEVRDDIRRFDILLLASAVQKIINNYFTLNQFKGEIPKFTLQDNKGLESERADRDAVLSYKCGVTFTEKYMLDRYDFNEGDIKISDKVPNSGGAGSPPLSFKYAPPSKGKSACPSCGISHEGVHYKFIARDKLPDNQQKVEELADDAIHASPKGGVVRPEVILAAVRSARSQDDLRKKLLLLIGDNNEKFEESFTKALYSATLMGFLSNRRDLDK